MVMRMPRAVREGFWDLVREGWSIRAAAAGVGVSGQTGYTWFRHGGGVKPDVTVSSGWRLSVVERDEISAGVMAGDSVRVIAARLGRAPSTISRELARNRDRQGRYRVLAAQAAAEERARRPKPSKMTGCPRLRQEVESRLREDNSPEQISGRLKADFPDDVSMRVSPETIYRELYVQARGGLKQELTRHLRRGRKTRKPRRMIRSRPGVVQDMVMIADRPAEVDERIVPGHWEGDLITGAENKSAIGTLIERVSNLTLLVPLPEGHDAEHVCQGISEVFNALPAHLCRTLTWDQGSEMARHQAITASTGVRLFFCNPHSPWQRASNENTNGLLRQYFPKGTDLSVHSPEHIAAIAARLNDRPRKRLGFKTPAEVFQELLLNPTETDSVAMTT